MPFPTPNHIMSCPLKSTPGFASNSLLSFFHEPSLFPSPRTERNTREMFVSFVCDRKGEQDTGYSLVPGCGKSQQSCGWLNTASTFPLSCLALPSLPFPFLPFLLFCCSRAEYLSMLFRLVTLNTVL